MLKQTGALERDAIYWHYPHYSNQGGKPGAAVRAGDYKLIELFENGRQELFNVQEDPSEGRNLIEAKPELAKRLATMLSDWRRSVDAQMPTANPDYLPHPQGKDGTIDLPGATAVVHGVMLRYEPLPHKNTLGYWVNAEDWASWDFTVTNPGRFRVAVIQGCGNGSGGSQVEFSIGEQVLEMTVEETGGFQQFREREIGTVQLSEKGRYSLRVKPTRKPGAAVMDLQRVRLIPE